MESGFNDGDVNSELVLVAPFTRTLVVDQQQARLNINCSSSETRDDVVIAIVALCERLVRCRLVVAIASMVEVGVMGDGMFDFSVVANLSLPAFVCPCHICRWTGDLRF